MQRTEINIRTGEAVVVEQLPYSVGGKLVVLDADQDAPEGGTLLTVQQAQALAAPDWRPSSTAAFKVTRDALLVVVNDLMAQFLVVDDKAAATLCLNLVQPLRDSPADPSLQNATSAADYKAKAIALWRAMVVGAPDRVVVEFVRAIGKL